jgi:hypothetical protein
MKPFFSYYGAKWRAAGSYPAPDPGRLVVECFAGSAGYSVRHEPKRALLIDAYEPIVGVWQYLIKASPDEILALPDLEPGQSVDDLDVPQEARWLAGFWIHRGAARPGKHQTSFAHQQWDHRKATWDQRARARIAGQLGKIRGWEARLGSYDSAPDVEATWFVDPPYQFVKRKYATAFSDYEALGAWCRSRHGTVIACDQAGANWLPFEPVGTFKATAGKQKSSRSVTEVAWIKG